MAVVLEAVVVVPVATAESSSMAVVLETVVPACSWNHQTWFCRVAVHSMQVGVVSPDTG